MTAHILEWLNLGLRWLHVVAGIAWIGSSFYFNWLDAKLKKVEGEGEGVGAVEGRAWLVHSGGFYRIDKLAVTPGFVPPDLHWFKWEAYTTWLSGFALLGVVFWWEAGTRLVDPGVLALAPGTGVAIALGSLVGAWFLYDTLCRSPLGASRAFAPVAFAFAAAAAFGFTRVFEAHAAFVHTGAMLGTLMAGNVLRRIIPAQAQLVAATRAGRAPDAALGKKAKQRSTHNNYMTLPVLFAMVSGHFPSTYGHTWNWAVLAGLGLCGAVIRHFFNLRNRGRVLPWLLPSAAAGLVALAWVTAPESMSGGASVSFAEARAVISTRCLPCHSATPTDATVAAPPSGVAFDTPEQIARHAARIQVRAVATTTMPLANKTGMTPEERSLLGRWIAQGARTE